MNRKRISPMKKPSNAFLPVEFKLFIALLVTDSTRRYFPLNLIGDRWYHLRFGRHSQWTIGFVFA